MGSNESHAEGTLSVVVVSAINKIVVECKLQIYNEYSNGARLRGIELNDIIFFVSRHGLLQAKAL